MEYLRLLSLLVVFSLISCDKYNKKDGYKLSDSERERIESIVENSLEADFYLRAGRPSSEFKIEKSFLKEIEGKTYLVSIHKEYRTNSLLKENEETMQYVYAGISCTSKGCSNTDGCIPKTETKCSDCGSGDCTKTVTKIDSSDSE